MNAMSPRDQVFEDLNEFDDPEDGDTAVQIKKWKTSYKIGTI